MDCDNLKKTDQHTLGAFTLAELLIVMVISGIVLLGIFSGIGMVRRLAQQKKECIEGNIAVYSAYLCLACFADMSDSVAYNGTECVFVRNGTLLRRIQADSLITGVQGMWIEADTLKLSVRRRDNELAVWKYAIKENEAEKIRYDTEQQ